MSEENIVLQQARQLAEWAEKDAWAFRGEKPPNRGAKISDEWWEEAQRITTARAKAARKIVVAMEQYIKWNERFLSHGTD